MSESERGKQRKGTKLRNRNKENNADNKEQDTLPYSGFWQAFFPPFHSFDLSLFTFSFLRLLNYTRLSLFN